MKASLIATAAGLSLCLSVLGGCASKGEIDETGGITAIRTPCPTVAVPAETGDVTLFNPANSTDASAIDVTATMTDVRSTCDASQPQVQTGVTFTVLAARTTTDGPRDVTLPYFITVVQGGNAVVAKRIGQIALHFDAGQRRAQASGHASASVNRAAATLSDDVRRQLTRKRKAGEEDAAVDPLTTPEVRGAVLRATFEALVGFQLTDAQLRYNATR